ncbi:SsrA-binding protein [Magnetococcus marinus MC-1]|uniref:SsrA-binding protein n=1 Tax=Magnetococcus marinus (strain ATCC BAA-1437 / JCM 17883 / MC-1) TaxID=156889 RepID=SSRP_MAGMM|nr:SsrA-binding protein SmpB [Magnetococcus marinus]A0LDB8.1 RecName: Full=SsrA-binding protein; AltName: Full=Small protein B [Magnetococcus marinus MC-1]ABK45961.1 SsrA-binding protein [Magnetococcus marinus MC-1]
MTFRLIAENRKARFNYEIIEKIEAGIVLQGTEVKSIRAGKMTLADSYAVVNREELYWLNGQIAHYEHGNIHNHEPFRSRKLLLRHKEISRLIGLVKEKGLSIIPLRAYWKGSKVKLELGIAKGKKLYDKRATTKERDWQREKQRILKTNH